MTSADFPSSSVAAKLTKSHGERLGSGESITAACRGGAYDRAEPSTVFGRFGAVGRKMSQALAVDTIEPRVNQLKLHLHRRGLELIEFPPAKIGYTLALTEERVLVFDASGKKLLVESSIKNMALEPVVHSDDAITLLFCEGRQAAAVTSWDETEITEHFIASYAAAQHALLHQRRVEPQPEPQAS